MHLLVSIFLTCTMMLSLDAASWASFTQRLTTSKLHFSRCCGQWNLLRGQKEGCPSCHTPVPSQKQSGPPHCPDPKTMDRQHSCLLHSPRLADFLPDPSPNNLPPGGSGVSKPLTPALPNEPRVSGSLLTRLSDILFYLQPTPAGPVTATYQGRHQGRAGDTGHLVHNGLFHVALHSLQHGALHGRRRVQTWKQRGVEQRQHLQKL